MFGGDGIIAEIGEEFRFGHGAPRVLRHDLIFLRVATCCSSTKSANSRPTSWPVDRQLRAATLGGRQPDLSEGTKPNRLATESTSAGSLRGTTLR